MDKRAQTRVEVTPKERRFIRKRAGAIRAWRYAGPAAVAAIGLLAVWMWFSAPLLINPFAVMAGLETDSIEPATLALMAGMLPLLMLSCLFVLIVALLLSFTVVANERRYLRIIRRFNAQVDSGDRPDRHGQ